MDKESADCNKCYAGDIEDIISWIVLKDWNMRVRKIDHLVGYDVMNYLIQASPVDTPEQDQSVDKYVVKLYRKCSQHQKQLLWTQNYILLNLLQQQYSPQPTKYPFPIPMQPKQDSPKNTAEVPTDKNIMYTLNTNTLCIPQIQQQISNKSIDVRISGTGSQSEIGVDKDLDGFVKTGIMEIDGGLVPVDMRVLRYIPGVMLGTMISDMMSITDRENSSIDKYGGIIGDQVPTFLANDISIPLLKLTQQMRLSKQGEKVLETYQHRNWQWHISSFLSNPHFFKQRYGMIVANKSRPSWHSQIINYFVSLYMKVESQLSSRENSRIRKSLIHNDANQWNIVVSGLNQSQDSPTSISIIDFGDLVYSNMIEDISIYTLYIIYNNPTRQSIQANMLRILYTYSSIVPITEQELKLFYVTVPMRMCLSLCNSEFAMKQRPEDGYVGMSQKNGWNLLAMLKQMFTDSKDGDIFSSNLFGQLRDVTTMIDSQQVDKVERNLSRSSEYGQHWTSEQQFWQEECSRHDKQSYSALEQQESKHVFEILKKYYPKIANMYQGIEFKVSRMGGYITKNFRITFLNQQKVSYTMKIYRNVSRLADYAQIESVVKKHLIDNQKNATEKSNKIFVPEPIKPSSEETIHSYGIVCYDQFWKCEVLVRLLTYLQGQSYSHYVSNLELQPSDFGKETIQNPRLQKFYQIIGSIGSMLGNLDRLLQPSLQSLHKAYNKKQLYKLLKRKDYQWNFMDVHIWKTRLAYVKDKPVRNTIECFVKLFEQNVVSVQKNKKKGKIDGARLKKILAHMDPTEDNCLISQPNSLSPKVDSIIDFDDIQFTYRIVDLTCVLAHCFHKLPKIDNSEQNMVRLHPVYKNAISQLFSRYHEAYPLTKEEIRCAYYFLGARIGMCITLQSRDIESDPGNQHIDFDLEFLIEYLQNLSNVDPQQFETTLLQACYRQQPQEQA